MLCLTKINARYKSLTKFNSHRVNALLIGILEQLGDLLMRVHQIPDTLVFCSTAKSLADLYASISRK
jgi:hypothetical protein